MGTPSLIDALDYLGLVAELKPERFVTAGVRWHGKRDPHERQRVFKIAAGDLVAELRFPPRFEANLRATRVTPASSGRAVHP